MPLPTPPLTLMLPQVYAGTLHGGMPVAIKVVNPAWLRMRPEMMWREAAMLQRWRHPCIVTLVGIYSGAGPALEQHPQLHWSQLQADAAQGGQQSQHLMVVTELMPGGSLVAWLADPQTRWYRR